MITAKEAVENWMLLKDRHLTLREAELLREFASIYDKCAEFEKKATEQPIMGLSATFTTGPATWIPEKP